MGTRVIGLVVLGLLCGCSSSDSGPSDGEKACQELQAKLTECHLTGECNTNEPCAVRCAANAECAEIGTLPTTGPYFDCIAACSGAGPDDFICADRQHFLNKRFVCDGRPQCPDGSDEKGCGAADAGKG
jgi:hypothetical protein